MSLKTALSSTMRSVSPSLWQKLKYRQYLSDVGSEPEIHILDKIVDANKTAVDVGVHLGMYTRHLARLSSDVISFEANPESAEFLKRKMTEHFGYRPR